MTDPITKNWIENDGFAQHSVDCCCGHPDCTAQQPEFKEQESETPDGTVQTTRARV